MVAPASDLTETIGVATGGRVWLGFVGRRSTGDSVGGLPAQTIADKSPALTVAALDLTRPDLPDIDVDYGGFIIRREALEQPGQNLLGEHVVERGEVVFIDDDDNGSAGI